MKQRRKRTFDLERAVATWRGFVASDRVISSEDADELESHLRDEVEDLVAGGMDEEAAFDRAVHRLGGHATLSAAYHEVFWRKRIHERRLGDEIRWRMAMFNSHLKIALRNLRRNPGYTFISIAGLAAGLACCTIIFLFVQDELRYDRFHEKGARIYRVVNEIHSEQGTWQTATSPPAFGPSLEQGFSEVAGSVRFWGPGRTLVRRGETQFFEERLYMADSSVFDVFTLPLVRGDAKTALSAPFSLVLSERVARKYFGDEDPVGQTLVLGELGDFTVRGVMADPPRHSHLDFNVLGSVSTMPRLDRDLSSWVIHEFYTYVVLAEGADPARLEERFPAWITRNADPGTKAHGFTYVTHLQPLRDVYLRSAGLEFDTGERGNITYVYAFSAIAVFILLIACFNVMNLTTARSVQRAREVGLRKAIGAQRAQLIGQFLGESVLQTLLALVIALLLVAAALPPFNTFTGKALRLDVGGDPLLLVGLLAAGAVVGILAGSYPAFFLSAFRPVAVLKGRLAGGASLSGLRRVLVVLQFAISIVLLIGTAVVYQQLQYVRHRDLGFNPELLVKLQLNMRVNVETVKTELLRNPSITGATASMGTPGSFEAGSSIRLPNRAEQFSTQMYMVDHDFARTYEMTFVAGRDFSRAFPTDEREGFVLNETAARGLGWTPERAIGQEVWWDAWGPEMLKKGRVIGVVKDFNYQSLHAAVDPIMMHVQPGFARQLTLRIRPENVTATLKQIEQVWRKWAPSRPFEYEFLEEELAEKYVKEEKLAYLSTIFAGLAILIACLGLFGLASFVAERRTKEIGIRKALGASVRGILLLLSRDFARLVAIAFVVAAPVAYYVMSRWLEDFAYRIALGAGVFLLAGFAALAIALLTVSYQTVRAARADPVKSLRYE